MHFSSLISPDVTFCTCGYTLVLDITDEVSEADRICTVLGGSLPILRTGRQIAGFFSVLHTMGIFTVEKLPLGKQE